MYSSRGLGLLLAGVILTEGQNVLDWESQSIRPQWSNVETASLTGAHVYVLHILINILLKGEFLKSTPDLVLQVIV